MHHANHFYGHAHIMARYVGLEAPPRIWGYLQHGWNMHDGFAVGTVFTPQYPKFVWSEACARRGWAAGLRNYMVVAAPWLYLLELERQKEWLATAEPPTGTIVYPFHGWEGQQVLGSHTAYIEEVKAAEGDVPITVCLHWNEYDNPKVRREYEDAGVRVVTHGQRGYLWQDTDVAFLYRQLHEMRGHRRVVSNRMSSAILYAASAGVEVGVYGDPMALESDHAVLGGVGKPRRIWPEMHQFSVPMDYAADVANRELGADEMLLPEEVIDAFGWADEIAKPGPPPPAPPLEVDMSVFTRRRRRSHRSESHRAPGAEEPSSLLGSIDVTVEDDQDHGKHAETKSESRDRDQRTGGAEPTGDAAVPSVGNPEGSSVSTDES
ncbi:hypothetical protein GCM10009868_14260 [Terrabacter aerolatus]|uniref:Uncharacterized protein n=1 Tax=Terrabacter aerolatus TaxID=422442 RepID=A0A512D3H3_9MICO|nr:hypothetical protein [Terrabacter aerolatus]GEO31007.1 hypothetical protein TAE01_28170 [Terrabacter aerolatus]